MVTEPSDRASTQDPRSAAFDALPSPALVVDAQLRIVASNLAARQLHAELTEHNRIDAWLLAEDSRRLVAGETPRNARRVPLQLDGNATWWLVQRLPSAQQWMLTHDPGAYAHRMIFEDMARVISHDMGAGIRHVDSFSRLLRADYAQRLGHQAGQWLDFIEHGVTQLRRQQLALTEFLRAERVHTVGGHQRLADILRAATPDGVALAVPTPLDTWIRGDRQALTRAFEHLFSNSLHHGGRDRANVTVSLAAHDTDALTLHIWDDATGVDERDLDRLFSPFFATGPRRGVGLGLAYCRRVFEHHGGSIHALGGRPNLRLAVRLLCAPVES